MGYPGGLSGGYPVGACRKSADEEFVLEINSGGGSVFAGFEMYSLLRNASRQCIPRRVQSLAGSAASVVMAGADTAAVSPVGQVMIHLPSTITEGNQGVHRESVQMLESITESIIAAYESKVGGKTSHDALRRMMDRETFLSARAALDAGLIDEIIGESSRANRLTSTTFTTLAELSPIWTSCVRRTSLHRARAKSQSRSRRCSIWTPPASGLSPLLRQNWGGGRMIDAGRLAAIKKYCRIDYDEDDEQLTGFAGDERQLSLAQCGINRDGHEAMYDLIVCRQWCSTSTRESVRTMQPQPWLGSAARAADGKPAQVRVRVWRCGRWQHRFVICATAPEVWLAAPVEQPNGETDYCYTKVKTIWAAVNPTSGRTETLDR